MAFDPELAERTRRIVTLQSGFIEKKMFGGIGFLLHDHMCVGVWKEFLITRIGIDRYEQLLSEPFVRPFDITGRVMRGWLMIEPEGVSTEPDLDEWIQRAIAFVRTLPPKSR